jgi:hypothetical protein
MENSFTKQFEIQCNEKILEKYILSSQKGKFLLSRALPLLHPSARFLLIPKVIHFLFRPEKNKQIQIQMQHYHHLFSSNNSSSNRSSSNNTTFHIKEEEEEEEEKKKADEKLCQAIVLILLYHPPCPSGEILTNCLEKALEKQTMETLRIILHNRPRAEVLQALLQKGAQIMNTNNNSRMKNTNEDTTESGGGGGGGTGSSGSGISMEIQNKWTHYQEFFVKIATAIKQTSHNTPS